MGQSVYCRKAWQRGILRFSFSRDAGWVFVHSRGLEMYQGTATVYEA
jgi:hypothetical protein